MSVGEYGGMPNSLTVTDPGSIPTQSDCFRIRELSEAPTVALEKLVMSAMMADPGEPVTPTNEPIGEPAKDTVVPCDTCDTVASGLEAYGAGVVVGGMDT